jgi:hypothetical protein
MKDKLLKKLSNSNSITDKGLAPWANWESENCSFGICFRSFGFYPKFLPLFINSDHGVHWESKVWPNETTDSFAYFTWNYRKFLKLKKLKIEAYHITHPWVFYKKKHFLTMPKKKGGTIVFFPHSNDCTRPHFDNLDHYFKLLKNLPNKYKPISIMLSCHDIRNGLHFKLRKYGYNLITAGNTNSVHFVKRFYDLASKFRYATAPSSPTSLPSAFFYSVDLGLSFFFLYKIKWQVYSNKGFLKKGMAKPEHYGDETDINFLKKINKIFLYNNHNNELNRNKIKIITGYLGLSSNLSRFNFSYILWKSFFKNVLNLSFFKIYFYELKKLFYKYF